MADFNSSPLLGPFTERKPQMSITLPRNFAPTDVIDPKTPDQTFAEARLPPAPHHTTMKVRRRPVDLSSFTAQNSALPPTLFASDIPIPSSAMPLQTPFQMSSDPINADTPLPSIEMTSSAVRPIYQHSVTDPSPSERLRLPAYREQPPRTPPAQTKNIPAELNRSIWDMNRAVSVCSVHSDSSISSAGTFTTRPTSFSGSATSPDTDAMDPFSPGKVYIIPDTPTRRGKKLKLKSEFSKEKVQWSIEMDNHLFNVYQIYLADPAVTPFKTVPGSIPPTGVCHRVSRRAKETWPKARRVSRPIVQRYKVRSVFDGRGSPLSRTPEPEDFLRTDAALESRESWPSESATRRRLKQLCKEKFTISAHYQRLRESRSPSPFTSQFERRPSSRLSRSVSRQPEEERPGAAYATRELGISLVASGATAPLAQLVTGDSPAMDESEDFFNTPLIQLPPPLPQQGLGIKEEEEPGKLGVGSSIPRLASPFAYSTWNGHTRTSNPHRRRISQNQFDTMHATGTRLLSPFKPEPDVSQNVNKRRALHNLEDELSPHGSNLGPEIAPAAEGSQPPQELIFTGAGDISQRRIRLRSRGATLGAVNTRERFQGLFDPPAIQTPTLAGATELPQMPALPSSLTTATANRGQPASSSTLALPEQDASQKRLGSPFELDPNKRSLRQMMPRHAPSLSDPFLSNNASSISERLAQFSSWHRMDFRQNRTHDDPFA
ncbi:uncharacterized protein HMPREF1541_00614 [Cyphellophora europaea CBS 101466]|uniref:Uncharacterized protein n=1 Tax=Cyphellophora europaea (strain CBS 101466) TaxID=1220924 RepID=W2SCU5_CYPE1|nr:uncharacterized protein HMPREF1541_00614 [Cyphellophora europaea CBS 101466]ETN46430.1 hypothetical protein HMPREF1541_00614 [Cyphellophora europaea CBS 101466]